MKNKLVILLIGIMALNLVSAQQVNFYYSPTCPHCQAVMPLIQSLAVYFNNWNWNMYDVTQGSYNVNSVPTLELTTNDDRTITLVGDVPIQDNALCELAEQSTLECPTSTELNCETNSFFIR